MLARLVSPDGLGGALRGVKDVLAVSVTAEQAGGAISEAANAVSEALGPGAPTAAPSAVPSSEPASAPAGVSIGVTDLPDDRNARIDEDILSDIQSEPVYGANSPN
jgi:hypothetical protein